MTQSTLPMLQRTGSKIGRSLCSLGHHYSPDMNIIEYVWDQLNHLIHAWDPLPHNRDEMWKALQEEWNNFLKEALDKLYKSMPHHIAALKEAQGYHTKY